MKGFQVKLCLSAGFEALDQGCNAGLILGLVSGFRLLGVDRLAFVRPVWYFGCRVWDRLPRQVGK